MADAADLKSAGITPVWVRLPPALLLSTERPARVERAFFRHLSVHHVAHISEAIVESVLSEIMDPWDYGQKCKRIVQNFLKRY